MDALDLPASTVIGIVPLTVYKTLLGENGGQASFSSMTMSFAEKIES